LGDYYLICEGAKQLLFTENETNNERICGVRNTSPYVNDGIHNYVVHQQASAVNPAQLGTKAAAHYLLSLPARGSIAVCLRLTNSQPRPSSYSSGFDNKAFDEIVEGRKHDADMFYATAIPQGTTPDQATVMRQALAGMLWTKQHYNYDVYNWSADRSSIERRRNDHGPISRPRMSFPCPTSGSIPGLRHGISPSTPSHFVSSIRTSPKATGTDSQAVVHAP
jgi:hypothetical protein